MTAPQLPTISAKTFLMAHQAVIKNALNGDIEYNRMLSIIANEFRNNPLLLQCTQQSLISCILQACQLGLRPGGLLGQFYFIPFRNNKKNIIECQFILGYKGMIELASRGDGVKKIEAYAVYENDSFDFQYGTDAWLKHIPVKSNRGKLIATWARAVLKSGEDQFHVCFEDDILKAKSYAKTQNIWETNYEAMARKTAIRRLFSYLPINPDLQLILALDEAADHGEQVSLMGNVFENGEKNDNVAIPTPPSSISNIDKLKDILTTKEPIKPKIEIKQEAING